MDSCHIFNFLFGPKRATTELSKCFANLSRQGNSGGSSDVSGRKSRSKVKENNGSDCEIQAPPPSPLKQLQMKITNSFTLPSSKKRGASCDAKCGTYRATLIKLDGAEEGEDEAFKVCSQKKEESCTKPIEADTMIVENPLQREWIQGDSHQVNGETKTTRSLGYNNSHNNRENSKKGSLSRESLPLVEPKWSSSVMFTADDRANTTLAAQQGLTSSNAQDERTLLGLHQDARSKLIDMTDIGDINNNKPDDKTSLAGQCKRVVMYTTAQDDDDNKEEGNHFTAFGQESRQPKPIVASAKVYNIVSEFGEARSKLKRVISVKDSSAEADTFEKGDCRKQESEIIDLVKNENEEDQNDKLRKTSNVIVAKDKRSVYVRSLVQSIELKGGFETTDDSACATPAKQHPTLAAGFTKPVTLVKPLPPKMPPKSNKAKYLNMQLNMNKPVKIQQLFQDAIFLRRLFDKLEPLDRCVAAQVCRSWRNILYANRDYWKDLVNVIDCTQLRREHLVECIINTLQSAKLKQLRTISTSSACKSLPTQVSGGLTLTMTPTCNEPQQSIHQSCTAVSKQAIGERSLDSQPATAKLEQSGDYNQYQQHLRRSSFESFAEIDQDDVWRIQELCNRVTQRACHSISARQPTAEHANQMPLNEQHHQQQQQQQQHATSKSSSIPSQISSTFSSLSISSLLSPVSESSRIESIKEKLYTSLDHRGFDAICLFGATDEDVEDLICKMPSTAHSRILVARLNSCFVTNSGLEQFAATFNRLEELELSGCNEITNTFDLTALANLKRLIITDCINIADGLAQKLVDIVGQLEELTIQAYHMTDAFLDYLSLNADIRNLKRLELPNCKEITNQSLIIMAKRCCQLEALSISGSTRISDDGVEILAEKARSLKYLDLSWCSRISDASLECIACDLGENLTDLILDRNIHITNIGLGYLSTMGRLTLLHIRWCPQISDKGLESIITISSLKYLSLAGLHQITAQSLLKLDRSQLIEVELTNCPAVSTDLFEFLSKRMPKCNIIF